jgi:hypothetical protein
MLQGSLHLGIAPATLWHERAHLGNIDLEFLPGTEGHVTVSLPRTLSLPLAVGLILQERSDFR